MVLHQGRVPGASASVPAVTTMDHGGLRALLKLQKLGVSKEQARDCSCLLSQCLYVFSFDDLAILVSAFFFPICDTSLDLCAGRSCLVIGKGWWRSSMSRALSL